MTQILKMTSKRQVTFPKRVCQELGVKEGQDIFLEKRKIEGESAWVLRPNKPDDKKWFGALHQYAKGKSHDMEDIRDSIGREMKT